MFPTLSNVLITYLVLSAYVTALPIPQLDYSNPVCVEVDLDELEKLNISYPLSEERSVFTNEQWEKFKDLGENLQEKKLKDKFYRGMRVLTFALKNYDSKVKLTETKPVEQESLEKNIELLQGVTKHNVSQVNTTAVLGSQNSFDDTSIDKKKHDNPTVQNDIDNTALGNSSKEEKEIMSSQASQQEEIKHIYVNEYLIPSNLSGLNETHSVPNDEGMTENDLLDSPSDFDRSLNEGTTGSLGADKESSVYQKLNINISTINQHQTIVPRNITFQDQKNVSSDTEGKVLDYNQTKNELQTNAEETQNTNLTKIETNWSQAQDNDSVPIDETSTHRIPSEQDNDFEYPPDDTTISKDLSMSEPRTSTRNDKETSFSEEDGVTAEGLGAYKQPSNNSILPVSAVTTTEKNDNVIRKILINETIDDKDTDHSELSAESLVIVENQTTKFEKMNESGSTPDLSEATEIYDILDSTSKVNNEYTQYFTTPQLSIESTSKTHDEKARSAIADGLTHNLRGEESDSGQLKEHDFSDNNKFNQGSIVIAENNTEISNLSKGIGNAISDQSGEIWDTDLFEEKNITDFTDSNQGLTTEVEIEQTTIISEEIDNNSLQQVGEVLESGHFKKHYTHIYNYTESNQGSTIIADEEITTEHLYISEEIGNASLDQIGEDSQSSQFEKPIFLNYTQPNLGSTKKDDIKITTAINNLSEGIGDDTLLQSGEEPDSGQYNDNFSFNNTDSNQGSTIKDEEEKRTEGTNISGGIGGGSSDLMGENSKSSQFETPNFFNYTQPNLGSTIKNEIEITTAINNHSKGIGHDTLVQNGVESYSDQFIDNVFSNNIDSNQESTIKDEEQITTKRFNISENIGNSDESGDDIRESVIKAETERNTEINHISEVIDNAISGKSGEEVNSNQFKEKNTSDNTSSNQRLTNEDAIEQTTKSTIISSGVFDATLVQNSEKLDDNQFKEQDSSRFTELIQGTTIKAEKELSTDMTYRSGGIGASASLQINEESDSDQNKDNDYIDDTESKQESPINAEKEKLIETINGSGGNGDVTSSQIEDESEKDQVDKKESWSVKAEKENTTEGVASDGQYSEELDTDKDKEITDEQAVEGIDNLDGINSNVFDQISAQSHNFPKTETSLINNTNSGQANNNDQEPVINNLNQAAEEFSGPLTSNNQEEPSSSILSTDTKITNISHNDINTDGLNDSNLEEISDEITVSTEAYLYENSQNVYTDSIIHGLSTPSDSPGTYTEGLLHIDSSETIESSTDVIEHYNDYLTPVNEELPVTSEVTSNNDEFSYSTTVTDSWQETISVDGTNGDSDESGITSHSHIENEYTITEKPHPTEENVTSATPVNSQAAVIVAKTSEHVNIVLDELYVTTQRADHTEPNSDEGFVPYLSPVSRHYSQNLPLPSPVPKDLKRENCLKVPEYVYIPRR